MREKMREIARFAIETGIRFDEFKQLAAEAMIAEAVEMLGGNQCEASRAISTHRNTLGRIYRGKVSRRTA